MSLLSRLKSGLSKSSSKITDGVGAIFTKRKLDDEALEELEELLITADMGAVTAAEIVAEIAKGRFGKEMTAEEIKAILAEKIAVRLTSSSPMALFKEHISPVVVLVVGVNGNGKTTTIGKLAGIYKAAGKKVMLAAADTFRAAAVEQLLEWGKRADIEVVTGAHEADPASVAFSAYEKARKQGVDILMIDTAGRLHNKANLMAELQKIAKVLTKLDEAAPHEVLMVLDATTGQNALSQLQTFKEMIKVSGLVVTKLDGTAKGGVAVALLRQFGIPIHAIGVGESMEDLQSFNAESYAKNLVGL